MDSQWYQIRFQLSKAGEVRTGALTESLLNKYIENILNECQTLATPFIIDIFALNKKNNIFDTSLPPLLFLHCTQTNDKLMNIILEKSSVNYVKIEKVTEEYVNQYRLLHNQENETVWSGIYMILKRASKNNLLSQINDIPNRIYDSANKLNVTVLDVVCPNIEMLKHNENDNSPIVVYIQHYNNDNDKIKRLIYNYRNIINIPPEIYEHILAVIDAKKALQAKNMIFQKSNVIEFKPESRVEVISGSMASLKGTVISQNGNSVIVNINILGNSIEVSFDTEHLRLLNENVNI